MIKVIAMLLSLCLFVAPIKAAPPSEATSLDGRQLTAGLSFSDGVKYIVRPMQEYVLKPIYRRVLTPIGHFFCKEKVIECCVVLGYCSLMIVYTVWKIKRDSEIISAEQRKHGYETIGRTAKGGEIFMYDGKRYHCPKDYNYSCIDNKNATAEHSIINHTHQRSPQIGTIFFGGGFISQGRQNFVSLYS